MLSQNQRRELIDKLRQFPHEVMHAVDDLSPEQLQTPYAPGKWSVEQVIHHLADAHLVAFARTKCVLTEHEPDMMDYQQDPWAELPDSRNTPVSFSNIMLLGIHNRWAELLTGLGDSDWRRWGTHRKRGRMTVEDMLVHYVAHGENHLRVVRDLRASRGWVRTDDIDSEPEA